jgi:hypothetical protein
MSGSFPGHFREIPSQDFLILELDLENLGEKKQ